MNPFISVWKSPRETVQYMIDNKTIGYSVFLAILLACSTGIFAFADTGFLTSFPLSVIIIIALLAASAISLASWGLSSAAYTWIGKLLGGTGNMRDISFAVSASLIPTIWTMPLGVIAVILYGKTLFEEPVGNFAITNMPIGFYLLYNLIVLVISIIGVIILSKGIGLVHNFSAWRGFGTIMIFAVIVFVVTFVLIILFVTMFIVI